MTNILNTRVLLSAGIVLALSAALISATGAFFSDSETSTGNTFAAGSINLTLEDWDGSTAVAHTAWNVTGIMPGDNDSKMVVVNSDVDAWAKIELATPVTTDGGIPGLSGELHQELLFAIEGSDDGITWTPFVSGLTIPVGGLAVYSATYNAYMTGGQPYYIRVTYDLPGVVDNAAQGDSVVLDVTVTAMQYENNTDPLANLVF